MKHYSDLAEGVLIFQKSKKENVDLRSLKVNCIAVVWVHGN